MSKQVEDVGIEIHPKFRDILTTDKRYVIITGGRGSGKSFSLTTLANLMTYEANNRVLYTRYTMVSAKISIIPEFEEKLDLLDVRDNFDVKDSYIKNKLSGSDILFKGLKTSSGHLSANMKSISGVNTWILDEAEELIDEAVFEKIDFSIRKKDVRNLVILILNPCSIEHWIFKRWFKNSMRYEDFDGAKVPISTHPDVLHIHTTFLDNEKHLSPSFVQAAKKTKIENRDKYDKTFMGSWVESQDGVVYKNWVEGAFDTTLPYCYAIDFGYSPDPTTMIKVAIDKKFKKLYIKECFYETEMSHENIVQSCISSVDRMKDLIVAEHDKRVIRSMQDAGLNVKMAKKTKIYDGIAKIQDYQIVVAPFSYNVLSELRQYQWNDKKASIPIDNHNHALDAMRYAFEQLNKGLRSNLGIKIFR